MTDEVEAKLEEIHELLFRNGKTRSGWMQDCRLSEGSVQYLEESPALLQWAVGTIRDLRISTACDIARLEETHAVQIAKYEDCLNFARDTIRDLQHEAELRSDRVVAQHERWCDYCDTLLRRAATWKSAAKMFWSRYRSYLDDSNWQGNRIERLEQYAAIWKYAAKCNRYDLQLEEGRVFARDVTIAELDETVAKLKAELRKVRLDVISMFGEMERMSEEHAEALAKVTGTGDEP